MHRVQQLDALLAGRLAPQAPVALQHQRHLRADRQVGIQRGHRVLEDHRHARAADLAHARRFRHADQLFALEGDAPFDPAVLSQQAHQRHRRLGLAGAGLADDAEHFARLRHGKTGRAPHAPGRRGWRS